MIVRVVSINISLNSYGNSIFTYQTFFHSEFTCIVFGIPLHWQITSDRCAGCSIVASAHIATSNCLPLHGHPYSSLYLEKLKLTEMIQRFYTTLSAPGQWGYFLQKYNFPISNGGSFQIEFSQAEERIQSEIKRKSLFYVVPKSC